MKCLNTAPSNTAFAASSGPPTAPATQFSLATHLEGMRILFHLLLISLKTYGS